MGEMPDVFIMTWRVFWQLGLFCAFLLYQPNLPSIAGQDEITRLMSTSKLEGW